MAAEKIRGVAFYSVAVHVVRGAGAAARYLLLRRAVEYLRGNWQMVVGRMKKGEKGWETAVREMEEETGLAPERLYNSAEAEVFYGARRDRMVVVPTFVAFVAEPGDVRLSGEHDAYEWCSYEEALARLEFPQQRRVLESVHRNFVESDPDERLRIVPGANPSNG